MKARAQVVTTALNSWDKKSASKSQGQAGWKMAFLSAGIFLVASPGGYLQPRFFFALGGSGEVGAF